MKTPSRADYADALVPLAARLVGAVHDEGPEATAEALAAVRALPAPDGVNPDDALAATLAAMVDPTRSPRELLAWTETLDEGAVALHPEPEPRCNPLAVEMALSGRLPLHALADHEARQVVLQLRARDWPVESIAEHLDTDPASVRRFANTRRKVAA